MLFWGVLNAYGIRPRSIIGLRGILFAPFQWRVGSCSRKYYPFLTFGWLIMLRETSDFVVTAVTMLTSGFGIAHPTLSTLEPVG